MKIRLLHGYKYESVDGYTCSTGIVRRGITDQAISHPYMHLDKNGVLEIFPGYAWDGSTCSFDKNSMRASLVHDALYQLMREGLLPQDCRNMADRLLQQICLDAGMSRIRAWWVYRGVSRFSKPFASPDRLRPPQEAP